MVEFKFSEYMEKHVHFSKVDDCTWLVQSNPNSRCEAYYVTVNNYCIVMFGDYDGIIVRPSTSGVVNLVEWMTDATTLSYFCEKVSAGNQYHETMKFDKDVSNNTLLERFMDRFELDYSLKPIFEKAIKDNSDFDDIKFEFEGKLATLLKSKEDPDDDTFEDDLKDTYNRQFSRKSRYLKDEINYDNMIKVLTAVLDASFENEWEFYDLMRELDMDDDLSNHSYMDYTHQIKWQHECLLWWSRHVVDDVRKAHADKLLSQVNTIVNHHGEVKVMSEMNYLKGTSDERKRLRQIVIDETSMFTETAEEAATVIKIKDHILAKFGVD